ncbi:MAG TPA: ABC transporter permease [Bacteroidota bacterium]|nr:ABC transporter permease [Bacteroidota bacterium]
MKRKLTGFAAVFVREMRSLIGDMNIRMIVLVAPLLYPLMYGSVYWNKTETDVPIVVVDQDRSALSREFIRDLDAHQLIRVSEVVQDVSEARDRLYRMDAQGIVILSDKFSSSLKQGKGADVKVLLNTTKFLPSNDLNKAITSVAMAHAIGMRVNVLRTAGYSRKQAEEMSDPVRDDIRPLFNVNETYGDFLVPGLFILILQQTLLIGLSESIAKERENGTLGELFHTANNSLWATMSGKGAIYLLLYAAYAVLYGVVYFPLFSLPMAGSISALVVSTVLFLLSVVYLSIFVSSFFTRKIIALQTITFTTYPFFFLSGYSWPKTGLPAPLQWFTELLPSTHYLTAAVRLTQMNGGWGDVRSEILWMAALAAAGFLFTRMRMRALLRSELQKNPA